MSFELDVERWCQQTEENLDKVIFNTYIEFLTRLVMRTPIGMPQLWRHHRAPPGYLPGRARAGWHVSIGAPLMALPLRPDAQGRATIAAMVAALPPQPSGKVVYFTNNVPYIWELERGHSRQSPPNAMVGRTVIEFNSIAHQKTLEVVH